MAVGMLGVMMMAAVLVSTVALVVVLFDNGRWVQNETVFMVIQVYLVLLAGMKMTTVAAGDWLGQALGYGIFLVAVAAIFVKKRSFFASRMILVALLILAPLANFLL